MHMCADASGEKMASNPMQQEFQVVVGTGNQALAICRTSKSSEQLSHLSKLLQDTSLY